MGSSSPKSCSVALWALAEFRISERDKAARVGEVLCNAAGTAEFEDCALGLWSIAVLDIETDELVEPLAD